MFKYENKMLIIGQNDIICAPNIAILCDFSNWQHGFFNNMVASHVIEPGSLLTEPGA